MKTNTIVNDGNMIFDKPTFAFEYGLRHAKHVFGHMRTAKVPISPRKSDQGLRCPQTESLDIKEYFNGERMSG